MFTSNQTFYRGATRQLSTIVVQKIWPRWFGRGKEGGKDSGGMMLIYGNKTVWEEIEVAISQHVFRKIMQDRLSLHMKIV